MKRHTAHDRLLALKLQGATHLARVLEAHPDEAVRLKAAMALARLAIPALPASDDASAEVAAASAPSERSSPAPSATPPASTPPASAPPAMPHRSFFLDQAPSDSAPHRPTSLLAAAAGQRNYLNTG